MCAFRVARLWGDRGNVTEVVAARASFCVAGAGNRAQQVSRRAWRVCFRVAPCVPCHVTSGHVMSSPGRVVRLLAPSPFSWVGLVR